MEDVWVETVHQAEHRDGKKNNVADTEEKEPEQDKRKRPTAKVDHRGQERKRAA